MFQITYQSRYGAQDISVIHDINGTNQILSGKVDQNLDRVPTFEFDIATDNDFYDKLDPINGLITVRNTFDNSIEFEGRILEPEPMMRRSNFVNTFICEGFLAYLNDSTQVYAKFPNTGNRGYLERILAVHNEQVEPHKRINVGQVTVADTDNFPDSYVDYGTTFEIIKTFLRDRFGGVFVLRNTPSGLFLDYLNYEDIGEHSNTHLALGDNVKSARRKVSFDQLVTRIVPVGEDVEVEGEREEVPDGQHATSEKTTIASVNGGKIYVEDTELTKQFGIIQKPIHFDYVKTPEELLRQANEFKNKQKIAMASWNVEVVEMSLLSDKYDKIVLGNHYPTDIPPISYKEELQVVSKIIDINEPQRIEVTIGNQEQTLSSYQSAQKNNADAYRRFMRG